ncbi:MAG: outer membrane lipoprotein carrier protein LolA [Candidatus Xenobiia bacterium LiM19]
MEKNGFNHYFPIITAALVLIIMSLSVDASSYSSARAEDPPEGRWVLAQIDKRNSRINDFTADLDISLYAFLMRFPISATIYFKRPHKVKIVFHNIPEYLKPYRGTFKSVIPDETFRKRYKSEVIGTESFDGAQYYTIKMLPEEKGKLKDAFVWVDTVQFTPFRIFLNYKNGSNIELESKFFERDGFFLIERQKLHFKLPEISAKARITYKNYVVNKGLDDSIFEEKSDTSPDK